MKPFYLLAIFALAGCATPEQRAERHIARYGPYCEKLGYQKNTDQWRSCIQKEADPGPSTYRAPKTCTTYGNTTNCY